MQENYGITYEPPSWSEKFQVKKGKICRKMYSYLFTFRPGQEVDHIVQ
jgi:hypothetical protein